MAISVILMNLSQVEEYAVEEDVHNFGGHFLCNIAGC